MQFIPPLIPGILQRRYKRFLADVTLNDGTLITASVPNTGSMAGLTNPGSRVWLSISNDSKRKYPHRLEIVEADDTFVGINTSLPNKLALEALKQNLLPELSVYEHTVSEQRYGEKSRIDFLLKDKNHCDCYLEVKNVHFIRHKNLAEFPDTVTTRGSRHLEELTRIVQSGKRAVMLYIIQRNDCNALLICDDLDPVYGHKFKIALKAGVEAYAIKCHVSNVSITPYQRIEIKNS